MRQRLAQRHEDNGPVDRVEAHDILAYDMQVARPVFFIHITAAVGVVANTCDVV